MEDQQTTRLAKLQLMITMAAFGTIGLFLRHIAWPSAVVALGRGFIGAITLIVLNLMQKKRIKWHPIKANLGWLILSGAAMGCNWALFFEAYHHTSVATATLCYYFAPIFVMIESAFIFKERLSPLKIACILLAIVGMVLVSGILEVGVSVSELYGVLLGLGAAILYGTVILINKVMKDIEANDKTIIQLLVAALVLVSYLGLNGIVSQLSFDWTSFFYLLILGCVHTGICYAMYFDSIGKIPMQTTAILSYIDPLVAVLLSTVFLRESLSWQGWLGAFILLGATAASELIKPSQIKQRMGLKKHIL